jgi:hypothetical protein
MAFSIQARISEKQGQSQSVKNNDAIVAYQSETIGKIERQYANGEIDRETYVALYKKYSEVIRQMGR